MSTREGATPLRAQAVSAMGRKMAMAAVLLMNAETMLTISINPNTSSRG